MMTKMKRKLSKFSNDRRGTAEIVGTVMFLVILLFAFTNVYLWHDSASREMNGLLAEKLNTPVSISVEDGHLVVINNGGFEVRLSRLWLINSTGNKHLYADLEHDSVGQSVELRIATGAKITLDFVVTQDVVLKTDGSVLASFGVDNVDVYYPNNQVVVCKILTNLGNMASCTFEP